MPRGLGRSQFWPNFICSRTNKRRASCFRDLIAWGCSKLKNTATSRERYGACASKQLVCVGYCLMRYEIFLTITVSERQFVVHWATEYHLNRRFRSDFGRICSWAWSSDYALQPRFAVFVWGKKRRERRALSLKACFLIALAVPSNLCDFNPLEITTPYKFQQYGIYFPTVN